MSAAEAIDLFAVASDDLWVDAEIAWEEREARQAELARIVVQRELALAFMGGALRRLLEADDAIAKAVDESIASLDAFERAETVVLQAMAVEAREKAR